jgi:hypothetical protein
MSVEDAVVCEAVMGLLAGIALLAIAALVGLVAGRLDLFFDMAAALAILAGFLSAASSRVGSVAKIKALSPYLHLPRSSVDVAAVGRAQEEHWERRWHFFLIACLPCAVVALVHFPR